MSNNDIVRIVIAAVLLILVVAAVTVAVRGAMRRRRTRQAEAIREHVQGETAKVDRRQALADETAARARAAQAEADAKAAEAERLQNRAAKHHSDAATSRERLQEQMERADSIDPAVTQAPDDKPDGDVPTGDGGVSRRDQAATHRPSD